MSMGHWTLAPIDPRKTIRINPLGITRLSTYHVLTKQARGSKWYDFGRVIDGDWDLFVDGKRNPALEETSIHLSVHERYLRGKPWKQTPVWESKMAAIRDKGKIDGCRNETELAQRYENLDLVFRDIATNGWKPGRPNADGPEDAISVSLTRSGGFMLATGGAHRVAIAKLLQLPEIEVYVLARHKQWQDFREKTAGETNGPQFDHPDLLPRQPQLDRDHLG